MMQRSMIDRTVRDLDEVAELFDDVTRPRRPDQSDLIDRLRQIASAGRTNALKSFGNGLER